MWLSSVPFVGLLEAEAAPAPREAARCAYRSRGTGSAASSRAGGSLGKKQTDGDS